MKKAKLTPSTEKSHNAELGELRSSATRTVDSFFSRKGTDAGRDMRALAIQKALESRGDGARRALKKYRLAEAIMPQKALPSGTAFEDYQVTPAIAHRSADNDNALEDKTAEKQTASREACDEDSAIIARRKRHAEWQSRLHSSTGLVPRRRSLNLDETEAREVRTALAEARGEVYVSDVEDNADLIDAVDENEDIGITAGSTKGGKAKPTKAAAGKTTKGGRGKKKEDVGPSGLVYSPLEKQVRVLVSGPIEAQLIPL